MNILKVLRWIFCLPLAVAVGALIIFVFMFQLPFDFEDPSGGIYRMEPLREHDYGIPTHGSGTATAVRPRHQHPLPDSEGHTDALQGQESLSVSLRAIILIHSLIPRIQGVFCNDYILAFCFSPAPDPRYLLRASLNFHVRSSEKVRRAGFSE